MQTKLNPYLNFKSNAREAMEFYHSVFGGKLQMSTFKEYHASQSPSEDNQHVAQWRQRRGINCLLPEAFGQRRGDHAHAETGLG